MSTISVSGLSQFVQSVSSTSPTQSSDAVQVGATTDASSATDASAAQQVQGGRHHHHGGGGGAFFSKIQSAVSNALQQAQSGDATDPNQAIQNAIESVLKGGGDPTNGASTDGSTSLTDPSATDPSATTAASSDPQQSQSAFFQTLQQFGVDPQQFHQDFLSALQNAQNGNADPSSVFQSFPPGSAIDTTG
jgi:hypothetical protein